MTTNAVMQVEIVSQEDKIFSGQAHMLIAAGQMGDLGIAPNHAPLLTTLQPGPVRVITPEGEEVIFVSGGILEVEPQAGVSILADTVVRGGALDEDKAQKAKAEAEKLMADAKVGQEDLVRAQAELARAVGLLRTIKELKKIKR